jgi:phosphate:Na+ symporter
MMTLWMIEHGLSVPLVVAGVSSLSPLDPLRAGLLFLLFQGVLLSSSRAARYPLVRIALKLSPVPAVTEASQPRHLFEEGMQDPRTALELSQLETARLVACLPQFLDDVREDNDGSETRLALAERRAASQALAEHIEYFIAGALALNTEAQTTEAFFRQRAKIAALKQLQGSLAEFTACIAAVPEPDRPTLAGVMAEGLHAILSTAAEALVGNDEFSAMLLDGLTEERSELMDTVRSTLLDSGGSLRQRESLLTASMAFERALWQLRGLARELKASRDVG